MAEIKLSELNLAGSELLQNSESFFDELSDREMENLVGGYTIASVASPNGNTVGTVCTLGSCYPPTQTFVTF
jgi:natural product precursor